MHAPRYFPAVLTFMAAFAFFAPSAPADSLPTAGPAQSAISAFINAPNSPLPAGTRLESLDIAGGLATVNFSRDVKDRFHGGDTEEADAVNGILRALGQFPTVSRVQILVAGRPVESLGGTLVISQPLAVIRPTGYAAAHRMYFHRDTQHQH